MNREIKNWRERMADNKSTNQTSNGQKFDGGKERFDLIPVKPIMHLAKLYAKGADKYGVRNWEKGIEYGRLYSAAERHMKKYWGGEKYDPIDGQHHLVASIWNLMAIMEFEDTHPEMDDRWEQNKRFTNSEIDYYEAE